MAQFAPPSRLAPTSSPSSMAMQVGWAATKKEAQHATMPACSHMNLPQAQRHAQCLLPSCLSRRIRRRTTCSLHTDQQPCGKCRQRLDRPHRPWQVARELPGVAGLPLWPRACLLSRGRRRRRGDHRPLCPPRRARSQWFAAGPRLQPGEARAHIYVCICTATSARGSKPSTS